MNGDRLGDRHSSQLKNIQTMNWKAINLTNSYFINEKGIVIDDTGTVVPHVTDARGTEYVWLTIGGKTQRHSLKRLWAKAYGNIS